MTMTAEDGRADGVRIGLNGIPLNLPQWPVFPADEQAAAQQVLASGRVNYWTGDEGAEFEREFAAWNGTRHALALANGTLALELALHAFDIGTGADVVTTPRTFIASASAVVARGGRPVFAAVDRDSGNITADTIRAALTPETRAVIVVHLAGWPADMDAIMELADEHGLVVIEDCAQAHGAEWNGRRVGSIGHAGAWSFCQDKIMTTAGEGGMLTLNDDTAFERAWSYRDHGKDRQTVFAPPEKPGYRYLSHTFGTNWRLSEVQAAVGRLQLQKLPGWLEQRRRNALTLTERFADVPGLQVPLPEQKHAFYKLYAYLDPARFNSGWNRERILTEAARAGVPLFTGTGAEIYREKAFAEFGQQPVLKTARRLGETSLMFLVHPTLQEEDMLFMADRLRPVFDAALS